MNGHVLSASNQLAEFSFETNNHYRMLRGKGRGKRERERESGEEK